MHFTILNKLACFKGVFLLLFIYTEKQLFVGFGLKIKKKGKTTLKTDLIREHNPLMCVYIVIF